MPKIMITCDDCGLSEGINIATLELHRQGLATAASIITNFPAFNHALAAFQSAPGLELGVHLNLTDGASLTGAPELTQSNGLFRSRLHLLYAALRPSESFLNAVKRELISQIEMLRSAVVQPSHVTTHLHFHSLPSLRLIILDLVDKYGVVWIRNYRLYAARVPSTVLLGRYRSTTASTVTMPDNLLPLKAWAKHDPAHIDALLNKLDGTIEIVIHPCTMQDVTFPRNVRYLPHQRFVETQLLAQVMNQVAALRNEGAT